MYRIVIYSLGGEKGGVANREADAIAFFEKQESEPQQAPNMGRVRDKHL